MKNVEVWGQTIRSWLCSSPDYGLTSSDMRSNKHHLPTYKVGSTMGLAPRVDRKLGKVHSVNSMEVYQNGKFLRNSYQYCH
jgi:hypothetical protein